MTTLRIIGAGAASLALLALVTGLLWLSRDHSRLQGVERRALACEAAVKNASVLDAGTLTLNCPQAISDAATLAERARQCDAALAGADLYAVRAACPENVKRRDAEATALTADNAALAQQLREARVAIGAAVTRAEARAATISRKDDHAKTAISRLVPGADGRITCDDQCLRDLTSDDAVADGQ